MQSRNSVLNIGSMTQPGRQAEAFGLPAPMESLAHTWWPVCREGAGKGQQQSHAGYISRPLLSESVKMVVLPPYQPRWSLWEQREQIKKALHGGHVLAEEICSQALFCFLQRQDSKGADKRRGSLVSLSPPQHMAWCDAMLSTMALLLHAVSERTTLRRCMVAGVFRM